jgi:hypothetical protein
MNSRQKFISTLIDFLNKRYGKMSNPNKDFNLFSNVLGYATEKVRPELVNIYDIEYRSDLYYEIINKFVRDNYGDGNNALPGDRIRLINMPDDPNPIEPNTTGTVTSIDTINMFDEDLLNVDWDNGRILNLIVGIDEFEVIDKDEQNNFKQ